jgi:solute carrier family 35 protein E3
MVSCHAGTSAWLEFMQVLGLLVSWSTFLMIGATSGLTFNVVGNLKLIIVLAGGVLFFGDVMPPKKLLGVCLALAGIFWYSLQVTWRQHLRSALGCAFTEAAAWVHAHAAAFLLLQSS